MAVKPFRQDLHYRLLRWPGLAWPGQARIEFGHCFYCRLDSTFRSALDIGLFRCILCVIVRIPGCDIFATAQSDRRPCPLLFNRLGLSQIRRSRLVEHGFSRRHRLGCDADHAYRSPACGFQSCDYFFNPAGLVVFIVSNPGWRNSFVVPGASYAQGNAHGSLTRLYLGSANALHHSRPWHCFFTLLKRDDIQYR